MNIKTLSFWAIIGLIAIILISPFLAFGVGYLLGILAKFLIGDILISGINTLFKTDLTKDSIPLIAGTLSWMSIFFKFIQYKNS